MNEQKLSNRLQYLCHELFLNNVQGKEFLKLMKLFHVLTPTFPQDVEVINKHGGALAWAAFREGQITLIRTLDDLAKNYADRLEAENKQEQ